MRRLGLWLLIAGVAACSGSKPAPAPIGNTTVKAAPAGRGSLADATSIEIRDVWVGLGCTHEFSATLTAKGGVFTGEAQLATGWGKDNADRRTIRIEARVIAALARAVDEAKAQMAATPAQAGTIVSTWTDDYPSGSMTFTTPSGEYRLAFEDQHRKLVLAHGGDEVPLDRAQDLFDGKPSAIWMAYSAVLDAAGLRAWIDALCER